MAGASAPGYGEVKQTTLIEELPRCGKVGPVLPDFLRNFSVVAQIIDHSDHEVMAALGVAALVERAGSRISIAWPGDRRVDDLGA